MSMICLQGICALKVLIMLCLVTGLFAVRYESEGSQELWQTLQCGAQCEDEPLGQGKHGLVWNCIVQGQNAIVKTAINGYLSELIDEYETMTKLVAAGVPCIPQLLQSQPPSNDSPCLKMQTLPGITMEKWTKDPKRVLFEDPGMISKAMQLASTVTVGHDYAPANFLVQTGDVNCPVYFIDLPQHSYEDGQAVGDKTNWYSNCLYLQKAFATLDNSNTLSCESIQRFLDLGRCPLIEGCELQKNQKHIQVYKCANGLVKTAVDYPGLYEIKDEYESLTKLNNAGVNCLLPGVPDAPQPSLQHPCFRAEGVEPKGKIPTRKNTFSDFASQNNEDARNKVEQMLENAANSGVNRHMSSNFVVNTDTATSGECPVYIQNVVPYTYTYNEDMALKAVEPTRRNKMHSWFENCNYLNLKVFPGLNCMRTHSG